MKHLTNKPNASMLGLEQLFNLLSVDLQKTGATYTVHFFMSSSIKAASRLSVKRFILFSFCLFFVFWFAYVTLNYNYLIGKQFFMFYTCRTGFVKLSTHFPSRSIFIILLVAVSSLFSFFFFFFFLRRGEERKEESGGSNL